MHRAVYHVAVISADGGPYTADTPPDGRSKPHSFATTDQCSDPSAFQTAHDTAFTRANNSSNDPALAGTNGDAVPKPVDVATHTATNKRRTNARSHCRAVTYNAKPLL